MNAPTEGNIFWCELKGRAKRQLQNLYTEQHVIAISRQNYVDDEANERQRLSEIRAEKHQVDLHHLLKSIAPSTY